MRRSCRRQRSAPTPRPSTPMHSRLVWQPLVQRGPWAISSQGRPSFFTDLEVGSAHPGTLADRHPTATSSNFDSFEGRPRSRRSLPPSIGQKPSFTARSTLACSPGRTLTWSPPGSGPDQVRSDSLPPAAHGGIRRCTVVWRLRARQGPTLSGPGTLAPAPLRRSSECQLNTRSLQEE
jgi:hypothetical protein